MTLVASGCSCMCACLFVCVVTRGQDGVVYCISRRALALQTPASAVFASVLFGVDTFMCIPCGEAGASDPRECPVPRQR